ncbi:hypothetical protein IAU60_003062 [Kwoniella sp. DSM 27419]
MTSPPPPPPPTEPPPPTYSPSQPQILVTPLPDSASFFWGSSVQGEVYVKGMGQRGSRVGIVKTLSISLSLTDHLPNHQTIQLYTFPQQSLYPPLNSSDGSSSTTSTDPTVPFPTSHRFSIPLPMCLDPATSSPLPGTLNLTPYDRGEIRWALQVKLILPTGQTVIEDLRIEGTPQQVEPSISAGDGQGGSTALTGQEDSVQEVEETYEQGGALSRVLIDQDRPRLGDLLRLGVEIRPQERKKTGVAGLSAQPDPSETLRPLRRVRVELFRKVIIRSSSPSDVASTSTSTSALPVDQAPIEHLSLLYASGKSLRYPGAGRAHPPVRVLFTVPTAQQGVVAEQTWGEISSDTPYHSTSFFLRVTVGFGEPAAPASDQWVLQHQVTIRPKRWIEPVEGHALSVRSTDTADGTEGDEALSRLLAENDASGLGQGSWSEDDMRREAYRQKGMDIVGQEGTTRITSEPEDVPPPFEGLVGEAEGSSTAGPSSTAPSGLPTFLESEQQARTGEVPVLGEPISVDRLPVPEAGVDMPEDDGSPRPGEEGFDRATWVGRRGSLGGQLGTWIEYDGYETFSVAPPPLNASYGVGGSMDPPQEGEEASQNIVPGMVARLGLGLDGDNVAVGGGTSLELMEQLGLGEGTRVVDLHDDLPPGIDEPSLPALPDFGHAHSHPHVRAHGHELPPPHPDYSPPLASEGLHSPGTPGHDPPSFDASQAASAAGGVATSRFTARTASSGHLPLGGAGGGAPGVNGPIAAGPAGDGAENGVTALSTVRSGHRRPSRHGIDEAVNREHGHMLGDAPPGYERAGGEGGLPPYS